MGAQVLVRVLDSTVHELLDLVHCSFTGHFTYEVRIFMLSMHTIISLSLRLKLHCGECHMWTRIIMLAYIN